MVPIQVSELIPSLSQSKLNPNQIHSFIASFFLCLQGQPELCASYHLIHSGFSFVMANLSHFIAASFSSFTLLSSSISMANWSSLLATTSSSLSFLSNSFSSPHFNLLRVARHCFSYSSVSDTFSFPLVVFWFSFSCLIHSLSFLFSSVSEAPFALSFSFLSEYLFVCFLSMLNML